MDELAPEIEAVRPVRFRPWRVLLGCMLFVFVAFWIYGALPHFLPLRIVEGPIVQMAGESSAVIAWYTSKGGPLEFTFDADGGTQPQSAPVEFDSKLLRCSVRLSGLSPGQLYNYRIVTGTRELARATFRANKPAGTDFSFIVFGDSGRATPGQYQLAGQMRRAGADFILHTGDLVYGRGARYDYREKFFEPYKALLSEICFWPCLGNHDVSEPDFGLPYRDVFELPTNGPAGLTPEESYWFDYGSARIAVVNSNLAEAALAEKLRPWLIATMQGDGPKWRFVSLHHPAYSIGKHGDEEKVQRALVPAFEMSGVDVVFCGHDHLYERTAPLRGGNVAEDGSGIVYVVTGAGGAALYETAPREQWPAYYLSVHNERHSFTLVSVAGNLLSAQQIDVDGTVLDQWRIGKAAE